MRLNGHRRSEAGYTLTELLVVLLILGLIAASIAPQVMGRLDSSKVRSAALQLETLGASVDLFRIDVGRYPTSDEGLTVLVTRPENADIWDGPYIRTTKNLIDPWGAPVVYKAPDQSGTFQLISYGADNAAGGDGDNGDMIFPDYSMP